MQVIEKAGVLESAAPSTTESKSSGSRYRARIIEAGQGSSAYYPEQVLENCASVFRKGTPVYFDHPTATEDKDRPERSVRDLVGKLVETAEYSDGALYSDIEFYSWAAPVVEEMMGDVGLSIRAYGTATKEADRPTPTLESFTDVQSVDVVTRAGAGGALIEMLESARPVEDPEITVVREATANEKERALSDLVNKAYSVNKNWVWVRDYDDTHVWFEVSDEDGFAIYQQTYSSVNDVPSSLEGSRAEVRAQTTYVPVSTQESTTRNNETTPKETVMNEEQEAMLRSLSESVASLAELIKPLVESAKGTEPEKAEPEAETIDPLEAAKILAASDLSEAGQKQALERVSESVTLEQAIEAQREYEDSIAKAAGGGRIDVDESAKPTASPFKKFGA